MRVLLCKDARNLLLDFCEGTLTDGQRTSLQSHLHTCLSCRKRQDALLVGLHAVKQTAAAQPVISDDSLEGVLTKIRELPPHVRRRKATPLLVGSAFSVVAVAAVCAAVAFMSPKSSHQRPKVLPLRMAQTNSIPKRNATTPSNLLVQTALSAPTRKAVTPPQHLPAAKKSKVEGASVVWTFQVESVEVKTDANAQPMRFLALNPQPFLPSESSASTRSFVEVTDSAKGEVRRIETSQEVNEEGKIKHSFVAYIVESTKDE